MRLHAALAALLILPHLLPAAGALHTAPRPDMLYLRPDPEGARAHNFTTHSPDAGAEPVALAMQTDLNVSTIDWSTPYLPAMWSVGTDATPSITVWIEGLDRVVALADPLAAARHPGQVVVQAELRHGGSIVPFARGETGVDTNAAMPAAGPREIGITLAMERQVTFSNDSVSGETLRLVLSVYGNVRSDDPLMVHVMSTDTPSRLVAPGFPVDAFRAWEDAERAKAECNARLLQDLPCETTVPNGGPAPGGNETGTTPVPWIVVLGAVALAAFVTLAWTHRRR